MKCHGLWLLFGFAIAASAESVAFSDETLHYTVNWPSGLSLGEGHLQAKRAGDRWDFELTLEAAVPGFVINDRYHSGAAGDFCSLDFEKEMSHGRRKTREKTTFDRKKNVAKRATVNGGKTEIPIPVCARDGLTFLFYARRELAQGRLPAAQTILFGAPYQVRLEYTGAQKIAVNENRVEADRVVATLKGVASDVSFEVFFARDAARTPLVVRAPFALGTFSMELVR